MRCAVISKGLSISRLKEEVMKKGGRNLRVLSITRQVYCDLDDAALAKLQQAPGLTVKAVGSVRHQQEVVIPSTYSPSTLGLYAGWYQFRETWKPPLTGQGVTIAILDSGIRKTHEALAGKVIYEANFTSFPTCDDLFNHGTGVAYIAAGGRHAPDEEAGIAPGAKLWNIKVLDDDGVGTEETVVSGIEECFRLEMEAGEKGLSPTDPMDLNFVNMSFGGPDEGDPDSPIRAAIRNAVESFGGRTYFVIIAAAGNEGPAPGSITCPACDPSVVAVGSTTFQPFHVWELSSRGPTMEGLIKPDFACYGVRTLTASSTADDAYVVKSGTSFSAPIVAGAMGAVWEGMTRQYGEDFWREFYAGGPQRVLEMGAQICVKPEGALPGKDNDYGYGALNGLVAIERGKAAAGYLPMSEIVGMATPLMGLGMMGMVVSGLTKGTK